MKPTEQAISQFVESQFPSIVREEGPVLVQFVKAYYEWLESTGQPLYHARRLPEYRDIDSTLEEFVTYFKLKYLPNIQFTTASSKRLFIKHALSFHRAKGSARSVEMFFRLIYGVSASIYYPGEDLLKLSDGEWHVPTYLEISPSPRAREFVGQLVTGVDSFATAFVESYNRIRINGKYVDVFYLSDLNGSFQAGEYLRLGTVQPTDPKVMGSVSVFEVVSGGAWFFVGERVGTISQHGQFATAIVANVSSIIGAANVELVDGGYGYNSDSEIIISDKTLLVRGLSNGIFSKLAVLQEKDGNGTVISNSSVVGVGRDHVVTAQIVSGSITVGQTLAQGNVSGVIENISKAGSLVEISVQNVESFFQSSVLANTTTGSVNVISYATLVGIYDVTGPGSYTIDNTVFEVGSGVEGTIQVSASTSNAMSFVLGANSRFTNQRTANVGLDYISTYASKNLNSTSYGFPKAPTANLSSTMITALRYETRMYGTISNSAIQSLFAGSGYTRQPFILIKEQLPYDRRLQRYKLLIGDQRSTFISGEKLVTGTYDEPTDAVLLSSDPIPGIVVSAVSDEYVLVDRLSVDLRFYEHDPANYMIIGETSGATARILKAENVETFAPDFVGLNADIRAEVFSAGGRVEELTLETSGYAYEDGEVLTFFSLEDAQKTGLARVYKDRHGIGAGYYFIRGGDISGSTFVQDNDYYQEFSYEIQTTVQQDTYKQMFDQVLHVAGTKGFSAYLSIENTQAIPTVAESSMEVEV